MSSSRFEEDGHVSPTKNGHDNVNDIDLSKPSSQNHHRKCAAGICGLNTRYTVAFMTMMGFIILVGMKCNLNAANVERERERERRYSEYEYDMRSDSYFTSGLELLVGESTSDWGQFIALIPGGILATRLPANRIFGAAICMSAMLNMLLPFVLALNKSFMIPFILAIRTLQGLAEGLMYPACYGVLCSWAPPLERTLFVTIAFCGSQLGPLIGMPVSGVVAQYIGWQAPFYFYAVVGVIWYLGWLRLVHEKPGVHPTISVDERKYIEKSMDENVPAILRPRLSMALFKEIAKSKPVYAIIVANLCHSLCLRMIVLNLGIFMGRELRYNTYRAGFITAVPFLIMALVMPLGGALADYLRKSGKMTTTNVRKLFVCGGLGVQALFLLVTAQTSRLSQAMITLGFVFVFEGFALSGLTVNFLDIAPRYVSFLIGVSGFIGMLANFFAPILVVLGMGFRGIDLDHSTVVFAIAVFVHLVGVIVYGIFASGEGQSWAAAPVAESQVSVDTIQVLTAPAPTPAPASEPEQPYQNLYPTNLPKLDTLHSDVRSSLDADANPHDETLNRKHELC